VQDLTLSSDVAREVIRCLLITCMKRTEPQLKQSDVASHLRIGQPMVNNFLSSRRQGGRQLPGGRKLPTWDQVGKMMDLFGTTDRLPILEQIYGVAKRGHASEYHTIGLIDQATINLALEPYAQRIEVFEQRQIHGLLQTRAYADALIRKGVSFWPQFDAERALNIRMARPRILLRSNNPVHYTCYLDESALYRMIITGWPFIDQLQHLLQMMTLPNVIIRIVPMDLADSGHPDAVAPTGGSLTVTQFTDDWLTGYTENGLAGHFHESPAQVQYCGRVMGQYDLLAMSEEQSRERIMRRINELEAQLE